MGFFLHIFILLYGLIGAATTGLRLSQSVYETLPDAWLGFLEKWVPESVFPVWKPGVDYEQAQPGRAYLTAGGLVAWALYYLNSRHRDAAR